MLECGRKVSEILKSKGFQTGLVNVTTVKPMDLSVSPDSRLIITIEDNVLEGGFGQRLAAEIASMKLQDKQERPQVLSFGWPDMFVEHGSVGQLQDKYGLTPEKIAERICEEIEGKTRRFTGKKGFLSIP
jgi:1-deoxy-D-xylulose-5-phosphate synthase